MTLLQKLNLNKFNKIFLTKLLPFLRNNIRENYISCGRLNKLSRELIKTR